MLACSVTDICSILLTFRRRWQDKSSQCCFSNWNSLGDDPYTLGPFLLNGTMTGLTMDLSERLDNYFGEDNDPT